MRKIILYIAVSLDGYIADSRGGVDWISGTGASRIAGAVAVSRQAVLCADA